MNKSYSRGHEIYYDGSDWRYSDDNSIHDDSRPCKKCNCYPTTEGYDACLGKIEGVIHACCGHGVEKGYIIMDKSL
jgi:hypothetical protein